MGIRFNSLIGALVLLSAATVVAPGRAIAESQPSNIEQVSLTDAFEQAFYSNRRGFHVNTSISGRALGMFLLFPDNEIARDGERVEELYRDAMRQQVLSDPTIRTPDLKNPFNSSLLSDPSSY